jgi:hypothetical protein
MRGRDFTVNWTWKFGEEGAGVLEYVLTIDPFTGHISDAPFDQIQLLLAVSVGQFLQAIGNGAKKSGDILVSTYGPTLRQIVCAEGLIPPGR